MIVTQITNHVQAALNRFIQQYQAVPARFSLALPVTNQTFQVSALFSIMAALVDQCQQLENAGFLVDSGRQLWNGSTTPAYGQQLDNLGALLNLPRNGLGDAEYLVFIFGTIAENNSDTTISAIVNIVTLLFQVATLISLEMFPAEMDFEIPQTTTLPSSLYLVVANIIQASLGAGIGLGFISFYSTSSSPSGAFSLDPTPPILVTTGNTTVGGSTIASLASTVGLFNGVKVTGAGIPAGTTATISGSTATLSQHSLQNKTAGVFVFGGSNANKGFGDLNDSNAGGGLAYLIYNSLAFGYLFPQFLTAEDGTLLTTEDGQILETEN